jgi:Ni/Co efflux regulator RcnB
MHMNKSLLAIATAALLLGSVGKAAAQSAYESGYDSDEYSSQDSRYDDRGDPGYDSQYDERNDSRYDDRNDGRYDERNDGRYDDRYDSRNDNRHDRRTSNRHDRDCDGISDRYDQHDRRSSNDRDRDGRHHNARRSFAGSRYMAPRGYRYARYDYGSRLPRNYWGSNYYIDYQPYGLSQPPMGYRWNRVGNDVYMVSTRDGLIAEVVYSLFR